MQKTINIIGAGVAGLAAGCYAQMNGYRSRIFELHDIPGGLCTAWEREGYIIDGCIHYLFGTGEGQPFNQLWRELGALENREIIHHDEFMRIIGPDHQEFILYCDPDRLEKHLLEISPDDQNLIKAFTQGIRQFRKFDMSKLQEKPRSFMGLFDWSKLGIAMLPFLGSLLRWGNISAGEFGQRFKSPFLRRAIPLMFAWEDIPMMAGMAQMAYMHTGNAGFPAGGSLEFAQAIESRYLELGGEIHYKTQVEKILVEGGRAVGVRLYNDEEYHADYTISSADARGTVYDMLDGEFTNAKIDAYYNGRLPILSMVLVSLGVARDLSNQPHWATHLLDEPILIAGRKYNEIGVKNYCFDPNLAPPNKSVVEVMLRSDYGYWQRIYGRKLYDAEQIQVADIIKEFLERIFPGIVDDIEVEDVATPLSYERYTGNWRGSTCGWLLTKDTMRLMLTGMPKTLPGLSNLYLAGQWVEPGGSLPLAAASGRNAIWMICDADGVPFRTMVVR